MRYKVHGTVERVLALVTSIALIICAAPAVPAFADETTGTELIKQVNFGVVNNGITGIDKSKITLSISQSFNKQWPMSLTKVEEEPANTATSWILAEEKSAQSMDASVKGGKIILMEGYGGKADYNSYSINAAHRKAEDVLNSATDVSAIISKKDGEILYYGKIDSDAKTDSTSSNFKMPKDLEAGSYDLYIFAEEYNTSTSPKTIYTSKLGNPVDIEVVPSLELGITGLDNPEPGKEPDTEAVLKVKNGNNTLQEENIHVDWADMYGNNITDKFEYNREYTVTTNLEEYITGYITKEEGIVKINGEEAYLGISHSTAQPTQYSLYKNNYKTRAIDDIIISGSAGSDNSITLKAYKGIIPPQETDTEYNYEWWNLKLDTSNPAYTGQNHTLTKDDLDNGSIEVRLNTSSQKNAASKIIEIKNGYVETDIIEGVTKSDETVKGRNDGIIEGLTTDMAYSWGNDTSYKQCTSGKIEGLSAGICYIKIDKSAVTTSGLNGIYACYNIGEGKALTVSFDSNGGNGINAIEGLSYNVAVTEPAQPERAGYTFAGWYKDTGFENKWDFIKDKVTQDIRLIAKWDKNQTEETKAPGNVTQAPSGTENPGNTTVPSGTTNPGNTTVPSGTTNPGNTTAPSGTTNPGGTTVPSGTTNPGNTTIPSGTTNPGGTTVPSGTTNPGGTATKTPQGNINPVSPYVPQIPNTPQTTNVPANTQTPSDTQAPVQTQTPSDTQAPVQTKAPENQPSQRPGTPGEPGGQPSPSPQVPESQPSQAPGQPDGDNNKDNNNTPQDNTNGNNNFMPAGQEAASGGVKYKSTGNGGLKLTGTTDKSKRKLIIPDTVTVNGVKYKVTKIDSRAFARSKLKKVVIGINVETIGKQAFAGCKKLKKVTIKEGILKIDSGAFKGCTNLTNIKLPSSVTTVGKNTFKNCTSLEKFVIGKEEKPGGSKANRELALRFGVNTAKVTIGASALENCTDLRSVVINSQVTKIGNSTFKYCSQLRRMLVKSLKLQKVGRQALKGVNNCKITVPPVKLKPYKTLFKNKGQGKKVVVAKG